MSDTITHKPLNQIVFERLHLDILQGRLKAGDPLRQEEITERFGVSRTPVREAIHRLQAEGLVTFIPRKGAVVSVVPPKKIREIYDIRGILEGAAAALSIDHLTEEHFDKLYQLVHEMEALNADTDLERILEANREFHYVIYSASGNDTLVEMIEQLWRHIQRLRSSYLLTPHGHQDSTEDHRLILEALQTKDRGTLQKLVRQHCERSKATLLKDTNNE